MLLTPFQGILLRANKQNTGEIVHRIGGRKKDMQALKSHLACSLAQRSNISWVSKDAHSFGESVVTWV